MYADTRIGLRLSIWWKIKEYEKRLKNAKGYIVNSSGKRVTRDGTDG